jgi:hypothetical protein
MHYTLIVDCLPYYENIVSLGMGVEKVRHGMK